MTLYTDHSWPGVTYGWRDATLLDSMVTHRGTRVEMVERPNWGIACYMDNAIQSCTVDEGLYHEALVHPVMSSVACPKRVLVIGGGEGATAREVLKWPVECVDMYEWDKDVVQLFQTKYTQWANGAWDDPRLHLRYEDVFQLCAPLELYDVVIIDLFDPSEEEPWSSFLQRVVRWIRPAGAIVMYSGIRNRTATEQPYHMLTRIAREHTDRSIVPYHVFIPSFLAEATFLLVCHSTEIQMDRSISSITDPIWNAYQTFNW